MQYIDTTDSAVAMRALLTMGSKHELQMQMHQSRFGKLGQLMTKTQKRNLKQALAMAATS